MSSLVLLDLSSNLIEEYDEKRDLPKNLSYLRLNDNPVASTEDYRKCNVLALANLVELDKVKVLEAERLFYRGLLPPMMKP